MTERKKEQEILPNGLQIGILGPIGAGKSSLSKILGERWGVTPIEEPFGENPFLKPFCSDPQRWSFHSQVWFINENDRSLSPLSNDERKAKTRMFDPDREMHMLYGLVHFQMGFMDEKEYGLYKDFCTISKESRGIKDTNAFIVVNAPLDVLIQRIKKRGRQYEILMLDKYPDYFNKLRLAVEDWVREKRARSSQLVIDLGSGNYNYVDDENSRQAVIKEIEGIITKRK